MGSDAFREVFEAVVHGEGRGRGGAPLAESVEVASRNKVLLHFLRVLDVRGEARLREEARYRGFLENLRRVASALEGLDHVFIKLRKPIAYVPADIDVLVGRGHVSRAVSRLMGRGFRVEVVEPYCVTMVRGGAVVDLYVHPTLGGMIYLDADRLSRHREPAELGGLEVPALKTYAEALTTIAHAVYKERIYTLNDYATVRAWLSRETLRLAEELKCLDAVREALTIHRLVEERRLTLPYRIPLARWLRLLGSKARNDRLARSTLHNPPRTLRDRRFGRLALSKLARKTY